MIGCVFQWLDAHSGAVQALATIALAALTWLYVRHTGKLAREAGEQSRLAKEAYERATTDRLRRALLAIGVELEANGRDEFKWDGDAFLTMHDGQYDANAWALAWVGVGSDVRMKIGEAYVLVRGYNSIEQVRAPYGDGGKPDLDRRAKKAFEAAQNASKEAASVMDPDPAFKALRGPHVNS